VVDENTAAPAASAKAETPVVAPPPAFYAAVGRRKTAVARVRLKPNGSGKFIINKKRTLETYFDRDADRLAVMSPLTLCSAEKKYDIYITLAGGGSAGQAGAARLGISRCLSKVNAECFAAVKNEGYLSRDSREKERRKYGRRGARARFQFSKR